MDEDSKNTNDGIYKNVIVSDKQAKEFAWELYNSDTFLSDVKNYIVEHQVEYKEFLHEEAKKQNEILT